jgi:hypothetical protein
VEHEHLRQGGRVPTVATRWRRTSAPRSRAVRGERSSADLVRAQPVQLCVPSLRLGVVSLNDSCKRQRLYPRANVATTLRVVFIATVHGPVPAHAPLHPVNREPVTGKARMTTTVPEG